MGEESHPRQGVPHEGNREQKEIPERAPRPPWSEFRARLEAAGFRPSRRLGQNFLLDENAARSIARDAELGEGEFVLEVGPGCGFLSVHLAHQGVQLLAVEIDTRLAPIAKAFLEGYPKAHVLVADVLAGKHQIAPEVLAQLPDRGEWHLVSNLPYSVSAPVLALLAGMEYPPKSMTVLVQEEMAERLLAQPGQPGAGPLSLGIAQSYDVSRLRDLGPALFWPRPKVTSTVVRFVRKEGLESWALRRRVTFLGSRLLRHRRQSLGRVLKEWLGSRPQALGLLDAQGLDPGQRADTLGLESLQGLTEDLVRRTPELFGVE